MDAIEGDGTPLSYLSASLFSRELPEFGAVWHGINWRSHSIVGGGPNTLIKQEAQPESDLGLEITPPEKWTWDEPEPQEWRPGCDRDGSTVTITVYSFSALGAEAIDRQVDRYTLGSYRPESRVDVVALGGPGFFW
jgi:hypothetical protein